MICPSAATCTGLRVHHAQRGSQEEQIDLPALLERMTPYFTPEAGGHMVDRAWQPRLAEGMVRAYLVEDRVAGFGLQAVNALHPDAPQPGPRLPLLWDCDFMLGDVAPGAPERYMLCEINVGSVSPFRPSSIAPLVQAVRSRLAHQGWPAIQVGSGAGS